MKVVAVTLLLTVIFITNICTVSSLITNNGIGKNCCGSAGGNRANFRKFETYKECMVKKGIQPWKIVDSSSNATYYNKLNFHWNKMFETVYPIAIFVPTTVFDVQATVKCGFQSKILLIPNSGGHSYAGLSLGTNDSIIVDFRHMTSIIMSEKEEFVTVEVGTFVGHLNAKLWQNGGWGTALGNCMTVSIGGHVIGGGVGYFSPYYGLVLDNILEMQLVDARGNALTVNPTQNDDLWWAMRGVGPGYIGLVTSVKLKMFRAKDLKLTFVRIRYSLKDFKNVMEGYFKWLDWVKQNDPHVQSIIFAVNDNYNVPIQPLWPGVEVQLLHIQDPSKKESGSGRFLEAFPTFFQNANQTIVDYPSYIELVLGTSYTPVVMPPSRPQQSSGNDTIAALVEKKLKFFTTLTKDMGIPRYFSAKSFFVKRQFSAKQLEMVQKIVSEIPKNTNGIMITYEQGAIGARGVNESAYVHRRNLINIRTHMDSMDIEEVVPGQRWLKKFVESTRFMDAGETYQNYPDIEINDYLNRFYGTNLEKLIQIKRKWDPNGYFNSKMSIPTK